MPFKILKAEDQRVGLRSMSLVSLKLPYLGRVPKFDEEIGCAARVSLNGKHLGITGTRPLLALRTDPDPLKLEFSAFSFRDCQRFYIYGPFGGNPIMKNMTPDTMLPRIEIGLTKGLIKGALGSVLHINEDYSLILSPRPNEVRKKFGYLSRIMSPDGTLENEFKIFPIWKAKTAAELIRSMANDELYLGGILYSNRFERFHNKLFDGKDGESISLR